MTHRNGWAFEKRPFAHEQNRGGQAARSLWPEDSESLFSDLMRMQRGYP